MTTEIVLGPPGTGKTTRLLSIVEEELGRGVPPDRIGFVTFTRKGANEAVERAVKKFNLPRNDFLWFRTLHSLCYKALGLRPGDVMERDSLKAFSDYAGVRITGRWADDGSFSGYEVGDRIMFMENLARIRGTTLREQYDQDADQLPWRTVEHVAKCLHAFKEAKGLMDYTDMLARFRDERRPPRLQTLLVDEAQDLSHLQWEVVDLLGLLAERVVVAGDDDQAIYRWAGADVEHLVNLEGDVEVLGQSWRVPKAVQRLADGVIARVAARRPKRWAARPEEGQVDRAAHLDDVDLSGDDILILARNQYILREQVEPELRRAGVFYEVQGGSPAVRAAVLRAAADWERLRAGGEVPGCDVENLYAYITAGTGVQRGYKKTVEGLDERPLTLADLRARHGLLADGVWHEALDRIPKEEMSYMLAARRAGEKLLGRPRVRLSTIHGAKGGQAKHVVLYTEMARRTFYEMQHAEDGEADEARVFYVGITRAQERLTVVSPTTGQYYPYV